MKKELAFARKQSERAEAETDQTRQRLETELDLLRENNQGTRGELEERVSVLENEKARLRE